MCCPLVVCAVCVCVCDCVGGMCVCAPTTAGAQRIFTQCAPRDVGSGRHIYASIPAFLITSKRVRCRLMAATSAYSSRSANNILTDLAKACCRSSVVVRPPQRAHRDSSPSAQRAVHQTFSTYIDSAHTAVRCTPAARLADIFTHIAVHLADMAQPASCTRQTVQHAARPYSTRLAWLLHT